MEELVTKEKIFGYLVHSMHERMEKSLVPTSGVPEPVPDDEKMIIHSVMPCESYLKWHTE